jgi:hypothetical protein
VAIKGKTKRSQGRPVRRPTPGPRPQVAQRPTPWFRSQPFLATLAVLVVLLTAVTAVTRVQAGWRRDDVRRFVEQVKPPLASVIAITTSGTPGKPGFASAADLTTGKLKGTELARRSTNWKTELGALRQQLEGVALSDNPDLGDTSTGVPANSVGGRVAELTSVRTTYAAGVSVLEQAALAFGVAANANKVEAEAALQTAQTQAAQGQAVLNAAAVQLAQIMHGQGLDVRGQLPGESSDGYSARVGGATTGS